MKRSWLGSTVLALAFAPLCAPATVQAAILSKEDHALLVQAIALHKPSVTLLVVARPGAEPAVAARLGALGATIAYRDDDVGYLRADVPVREALEAAATDGIVAASVDQKLPEETPPPRAAEDLPVPGPGTPAANPLVPVGDVGAPQFIAAHPTFDGRGTTLGIIDDGIDLLTPELRWARLADGTVVDKVVDYVTTSDPAIDPSWVDMSAQARAVARRFVFAGSTYTAPADGRYRVGVLDERAPGFPIADHDVDRDGNPPGSGGQFAVLWDTGADRVWVDTDRDRSFADQRAMTNYRDRHDVGVFGVDDPATAVRETVPFAVQIDAGRKLVNVLLEEQVGHGTQVASVGVGTGFLGTRAAGAAPAARLAVVRYDHTDSSIIEGALHLAKRDHVDVINLSFGTAVGATTNPESVVLNRIVDRFGIQVFAAAGNDRMAANTVAAPSTTLHTVSLGASATRETTRKVSGYDLGVPEGIEWFSSRGPSLDGALKPDLAAPGMSWVALPGWLRSASGAPPGYDRAHGTSLSSPIAAGAALLLLSAARRSGVRADADQLRQAMFSGARRLSTATTHEQGRGVVSVDGAWKLLRQGIEPVGIDVSAPVNNAWSLAGDIPATGPGLYEREGWKAGQTGQRAIMLRRVTGRGAAIPYRLSLSGSDGTFTVPLSVTLAKGAPVTVLVGIHPRASGLHDAILNVDDPTTVGIDAQVALTMIAAEQFDDTTHYAITHTGTVANDEVADFFFSVPPEAFSFDTELSAPSVSDELSWSLATPFQPLITIANPRSPFGFIDREPVGCWVPSASSFCNTPPVGRVWEFAISTALQSAARTPFTLKTAVRGHVDVSPSPVVIDPATTGTTYDRTLRFATSAIGFDGQARGSDLGPLHAEHPTLTSTDEFQEVFDVAPGAGRLTVEVDHAPDPETDLDLFLLHCIDPDCTDFDFLESSTTPTSTEWIDVSDPSPGTWVAFVDPSSVPSGSTEFDYARVATDPKFGSIAVDDADAFHPAFDHWTRDIHVTPLQVPDGGERLRGYVRTTGGWTDVDVRAHDPGP